MASRGLYVGLMSGTSLDAIDAALVEIEGSHAKLLASHSEGIPTTLRCRLLDLAESTVTTLEEIGEADRELGVLFAEATRGLLRKVPVPPHQITAIGSHGQTIRHRPGRTATTRGFTCQIADPNTIAELTGICTVADFRRRDVAAGGQGAPLVPAFHQEIFGKAGVERVVANIGGISNISLLFADRRVARGFDTGPGNALMDAWTLRHRNLPFDDGGIWAMSGEVDKPLLDALLDHPFFRFPAPKSTGREDFNIAWLDQTLAALPRCLPPENTQSTLLELTAQTLTKGILDAMPECSEVYLCGGGARNGALVDRIARLLDHRSVATTEVLGIHPDWVEACAFAWLAHQALQGRPGNLPSVTGASRPVVLGGIYPGA